MTDIDPAAVMAAHAAHCESPLCCEQTRPDHEYNNGHCEPYRLAEALAASEAKVARVQALVDSGECGEENRWREAISNQPEQAS